MKDNAKLIKKMNEVCSCDKDKYCLLKEIICCSHNDARFLIQLKVIEIFKYNKSKELGYDLGWELSHIEWVSCGAAKKFAEVYNEDLSAVEIYKKIFSDPK